MIKDYARRDFKASKKKPPRSHHRVVGFCVIFIVAILILFICEFKLFSKHDTKQPPAVAAELKHQAELKKLIAAADTKRETEKKLAAPAVENKKTDTVLKNTVKTDVKTPVKKEEAPFKFDFYTLLPKMHVEVPKETGPHYAHEYLLVFGTRPDFHSANDFANALGAMGASVNVVSFPSQGTTMYRVVSDPFPTEASAQRVQNQMRSQGKSSTLVKIR